MTIEELLSESVDSARQRERTAFDELAGPLKNRIVLFGAGTVGRKVAAALLQTGISVLAFADNNPALQGNEVDGISVISPQDAVARWRNDAIFVVTIFHPADRGMAARLQHLRDMGCGKVISFLSIGWKIDGVLPHFAIDRPSRLLAEAGSLLRVANLWNDKLSREIFREQLSWRLRDDFLTNREPSPDQYFPRDLLRSNPNEAFVDGGAFDGDTVRAMPWKATRVWAIEPDPTNLAKLKANVQPHVGVCPVALGRSNGKIRFNAAGTMGSARSAAGALQVQVARLDDIIGKAELTFLKLDVEGEELAALEGAKSVLMRSQPVAAVCIYHRPEDLWTIPLFLRNILPAHKFALRIHAHDGFELVAYAIPPSRIAVVS